jgi:hypothetical protein
VLAGLAIGASARVRPLIAALLGGGIGIAGYCALLARTTPTDRDTVLGFAIFAGGGAIVTTIGTAIGWAAFGRRSAA